jgi:hypothetical protein
LISTGKLKVGAMAEMLGTEAPGSDAWRRRVRGENTTRRAAPKAKTISDHRPRR